MSLIDIQAVKAEAEKQVREEATKSATNALVAQMRRVQDAERNLNAQKLILADIEAQIADGTLPK